MFVQHATGEFQVDVGGLWHCGPDHTSPKRLVYDVKIVYPDDALDEHGFLVDNESFQQYFGGLGYTEDSCELLAKHCCEYFKQLAQGKAKDIQVDIAVPGLADITYEEGK